jgi:hypothetical protein
MVHHQFRTLIMRATVFGGKMRDAMRPKSHAAVRRNQSLNQQCAIGVRKRTPRDAAEKRFFSNFESAISEISF